MRLMWIFGLAVLMFETSVQAAEVHCKGKEANLRVFEEMTEVLFNRRNEAQASKYYAATVMNHNADAGGSGTVRVPIADMQQMWRASKAFSPDRTLVNELIICADDILVARTTMTGTMTGAMGSIPATGKKFDITATDTYRFKDGKVVERWGNNDQITMLKQLGVLGLVAKAEAARSP